MKDVLHILELFDELDSDEFYELSQQLVDRGYELKVNRKLEKTKSQKAALFLKSFNEEYTISVIKTIRNLHKEFGEKYSNLEVKEFGLKEAKDLVQNKNAWEITPLMIGDKKWLDQLHNILKYDNHYNDLQFEIR